MKFKAISTFVIFDGQMNVFNAGDKGDLPEELISSYIANGKAEPLTGKKGRAAKADPQPEPESETAAHEAPVADEPPAAPVADADAPPA